jgi:tRNA-2-methylthio-N6-dimethylallyladenosine synthase
MRPSEKKIFVYTIGCQMNVYDSDRMIGGMAPAGYRPTSFADQADLILVNTCTIRAKAEQKAFSFLGRLSGLKHKKPHLIIGVTGCVAQQVGEKIFKRMPHVDLVLGTQAIGRLPAIIRRIEAKRCRVVDVALDTDRHAEGLEASRSGSATAITRFVTIMRGCDNYCTYCVVPYVRGRETSRPPEDIVKEIAGLVAAGVREVTLLGQNVNSYGQKEGLCSFADLLARVDAVEGLQRIRFTTSHPKDLSGDLVTAFGSVEKLCRHIHLPVQSGADRILGRMNRKYTRAGYLDKVAQLRAQCPEIEITTDIIVGFPGETAKDFESTLDLIRQVAYDGLFVFNYSDRPQTPAAHFSGKVLAPESNRRLQAVLALQEQITRTKNEGLVGTVARVLVEGHSKKQDGSGSSARQGAIEWTGRTFGQRIVNFTNALDPTGRRIVPGDLVKVKIERALSHSLRGRAVWSQPTAGELKGESSYAA